MRDTPLKARPVQDKPRLGKESLGKREVKGQHGEREEDFMGRQAQTFFETSAILTPSFNTIPESMIIWVEQKYLFQKKEHIQSSLTELLGSEGRLCNLKVR